MTKAAKIIVIGEEKERKSLISLFLISRTNLPFFRSRELKIKKCANSKEAETEVKKGFFPDIIIISQKEWEKEEKDLGSLEDKGIHFLIADI
ncbi:MAG: hypothetical protein PHH17_02225 [Candidatus Pacebacteria bacterium]|jgi:hypothetical protein|nr:hypothetical protein [Candidatus Paceibacterota bacterium]MDD3072476.1 hypothetical protein [Candidatus Paceibacterota bacterium]MDD3729224.1 hypothetical protein [Candidatus Paceibacterota bacterium]MDD4201694.1 hypothetical protein [Candidatus Paceibacterota bacterium]MDD4466883.1 hypothetical protein [Candidatus Paceibacterota bacterium]